LDFSAWICHLFFFPSLAEFLSPVSIVLSEAFPPM
jgi:hypothetical protein